LKADIDRLMADRGFLALIVTGGEEFNTARYYLCNGAPITHGTVFRPQGGQGLLVCSGIELAVAAESGLPVKTAAELGYFDRLAETKGDRLEATALHWRDVLRSLGISSGKIALYGTWQINKSIALYQRLCDSLREYELVVEPGRSLIEEAMLSKDADELARIHSVAERTNEVMSLTWDTLASLRPDGDFLLDEGGQRVTIGDIKALVRRELMARGLQDTHMIFAQGADAGHPHKRGDDASPLQIGQAIVFDLFPCELGGGYHHDMTRTWCIGTAPPELQAAYETVMEAFDIALESYGLQKPAHLMQRAVQDYFERAGHATTRSDPKTSAGYTHSLGHGVGINIHEGPAISHLQENEQFQVGNVLTIEPGLYYPERGFGVRVEDLFFISEQGELQSLSPFHKDLVIPIQGIQGTET